MSERASGPGPITKDGSPVEMYLLLPPGDEPDIIDSAIRPGGSILELGCGVGRITHGQIRRLILRMAREGGLTLRAQTEGTA